MNSDNTPYYVREVAMKFENPFGLSYDIMNDIIDEVIQKQKMLIPLLVQREVLLRELQKCDGMIENLK